MTDNRKQLIAALADEASIIRHPGRYLGDCLRWMLVSVLAAGAIIALTGTLHADTPIRIFAQPLVGLRFFIGLLACLALGLLAFRSSIPSPLRWPWLLLLPLALLSLWLMLHGLSPSTRQFAEPLHYKRDWCWLHTLIAGLPGLALGLYRIGRYWPLAGGWSGGYAGLAAGGIAALLMQAGCLVAGGHALQFHLMPALVLGLAGLVAGHTWIRPGHRRQ